MTLKEPKTGKGRRITGVLLPTDRFEDFYDEFETMRLSQQTLIVSTSFGKFNSS